MGKIGPSIGENMLCMLRILVICFSDAEISEFLSSVDVVVLVVVVFLFCRMELIYFNFNGNSDHDNICM